MSEHETVTPEQEAAPETAAEAAPEAAAPAAEEQLAQLEDRYKRVLAEYDNFRKRSQKERETVYQDACSATVAAFLPVLDNLERAQAAHTDDKGTELIIKQFLDVLARFGVTPCGAVGEPFDPNLHNAVAHVEDESMEENTIAEVLLKGYVMGTRVVRFAMVRVAN